MSNDVWDEDGDCVSCSGNGELDCPLCMNDDPDRFYYGDTCVDCGSPEGVVGGVQCPTCSGFGTLAAAVDAGYATYD